MNSKKYAHDFQIPPAINFQDIDGEHSSFLRQLQKNYGVAIKYDRYRKEIKIQGSNKHDVELVYNEIKQRSDNVENRNDREPKSRRNWVKENNRGYTEKEQKRLKRQQEKEALIQKFFRKPNTHQTFIGKVSFSSELGIDLLFGDKLNKLHYIFYSGGLYLWCVGNAIYCATNEEEKFAEILTILENAKIFLTSLEARIKLSVKLSRLPDEKTYIFKVTNSHATVGQLKPSRISLNQMVEVDDITMEIVSYTRSQLLKGIEKAILNPGTTHVRLCLGKLEFLSYLKKTNWSFDELNIFLKSSNIRTQFDKRVAFYGLNSFFDAMNSANGVGCEQSAHKLEDIYIVQAKYKIKNEEIKFTIRFQKQDDGRLSEPIIYYQGSPLVSSFVCLPERKYDVQILISSIFPLENKRIKEWASKFYLNKEDIFVYTKRPNLQIIELSHIRQKAVFYMDQSVEFIHYKSWIFDELKQIADLLVDKYYPVENSPNSTGFRVEIIHKHLQDQLDSNRIIKFGHSPSIQYNDLVVTPELQNLISATYKLIKSLEN